MRGLTGERKASAAPPADIEARARPVLDRRLRKAADAPIAVGFSGGGDSLALLLVAHAWAGENARRLIALHVDHGLQPQSGGWAARCAAKAAGLGIDVRTLTWRGEKPSRGLPAAARLARHRLLAEAARAAGAKVILLGHTASDLAETAAMRMEGATTPLAREWSPSPVWPEGRGLFLLRPLLGVGRGEIRAWLEARGETWVDDPANLDLGYARARARAAGASAPTSEGALPARLAELAREVVVEPGDVLRLSRARLRDAADDTVVAFLSAASLCAGGGERPPRRERVEALAARLRSQADVTATLAGARVEAEADSLWFMREAGEAARGGLAEVDLPPGVPLVWDGRYEILSPRAASVRRLAGAVKRLEPGAQRALLDVRARARGALPLLLEGEAVCPALGEGTARACFLAHERLMAACGVVVLEPA